MTLHRVHLEAVPHGAFAAAVGPFDGRVTRDNVRFGQGPTAADAISRALHIGVATFASQDAELDALRSMMVQGRDLLISVRGRVIATIDPDSR